ncbi:MAG TPA: 50S ribosomal protein L3 [Dehalococcoidia bacterium]|nr:50S ribosomal protein L3 [Dehalococcoidia bacterium]
MPALFGKKLGMLQVFDDAGTVQNVTAIELGPCVVTMIRTPQTDGYSAVQLGWGEGRNLNKPAKGHLAGANGDFRHLREVRVDDSAAFSVGQEVTTSIFQAGERVDVTSKSKGRGFAGGVKRHGFHGGPKTHGQSDRHRAPGSIGAGTTPGHVLKGQKMAGHMGARQVTVRDLVVVRSDIDKNLLLVRGSVPGPVNGVVRVKRTTRAVS